MDPLERPLITAAAMVAAVATLVLLALPGPLVAAAWPATGSPVALECRLQPLGERQGRLTLTHGGDNLLPAGTRLAWVTLGAATPQGQVLSLPRALAPGESIALGIAPVGEAARCEAVASAGGPRSSSAQ